MKIAVINEISTCTRNPDILEALKDSGCEIYNAGMYDPKVGPELTYMHTGLMSALLLNLGAVDLVIGGCGTGQGFMNAVLQFPGVTAVLVTEPLDAWLAKRINAPNCISLALNKGYGWAADQNLKLIVKEIITECSELGYPSHRVESQTESRRKLAALSVTTHKDFCSIITELDFRFVKPLFDVPTFKELVYTAEESDLKNVLLKIAETNK